MTDLQILTGCEFYEHTAVCSYMTFVIINHANRHFFEKG